MDNPTNPVPPARPTAPPDVSRPSPAQPIPVCQERHHPVVFENEYVRLLDVQLKPGEVTDCHFHDVASVIVYVTKATVRSQKLGESVQVDRATTPGGSRYAAFDREPLVHVVSNPGTAHFRVFDIELVRQSPDPAAQSAPPPPDAEVQWNEQLVRSSTFRLQPGMSIETDPSPCAHLLIGIRGNTTSVGAGDDDRVRRDLGNGDFRFFAKNAAFEIANLGDEESEVVLLELR